MKRTHKKSIITVFDINNMYGVGYILQMEPVVNSTFVIVEYLKGADIEEYLTNTAEATPDKNIVDMEYENALTTVLNNDPRGQFSGKTLKDIFDAPNGIEWVEWALRDMKNKFIVDRVRTIYNHRRTAK